jgi:hypothetical protein
MEQLDEVIEEIRKLMSESAEELVSKRKLDERKPTRETRKMQEQKQRSRGAKRQLQEKVWDLGGFQPRWKSHEQELMIFSTVEYDAGASLHLSTRQLINTHGAHSRKERHRPLIFSSRIQGVIQALIEDKMEEPNHAFTSWR